MDTPNLAVSPRRLRPRRTLPPPLPPQPSRRSVASLRSPSSGKKSSRSYRGSHVLKIPNFRASVSVESPSKLPEYQAISSDLMAMARQAKESGIGDVATTFAFSPKSPPLFEKGKFYEVYSARRNERLKRKMGVEILEEAAATAMAQDPGVAVELAKKRTSKKAAEGQRKSMPPEFSGSCQSTLRSSVRSGREMKKPAAAAVSESSAATGRRSISRYGRKI